MDGREFERDSRAPSKKEVRATRMKGIIVPLYACAECCQTVISISSLFNSHGRATRLSKTLGELFVPEKR